MRVQLSYIDKRERLMHMVRFADSKICCFSSNNYDMVVVQEWGSPINFGWHR